MEFSRVHHAGIIESAAAAAAAVMIIHLSVSIGRKKASRRTTIDERNVVLGRRVVVYFCFFQKFTNLWLVSRDVIFIITFTAHNIS
jgi:hypothetical protein